MNDWIFGISGMVVGIVSLICTIIALSRNRSADDKNAGKEGGVVLTELGYIKAGVDDLKRDNRDIRGDLKSLDERITRNEESTKNAHKRIDALSKYHEPDKR
jgi:peptidoglycan hydrolase CwlO-like protein